jgi:hypothetical protein
MLTTMLCSLMYAITRWWFTVFSCYPPLPSLGLILSCCLDPVIGPSCLLLFVCLLFSLLFPFPQMPSLKLPHLFYLFISASSSCSLPLLYLGPLHTRIHVLSDCVHYFGAGGVACPPLRFALMHFFCDTASRHAWLCYPSAQVFPRLLEQPRHLSHHAPKHRLKGSRGKLSHRIGLDPLNRTF